MELARGASRSRQFRIGLRRGPEVVMANLVHNEQGKLAATFWQSFGRGALQCLSRTCVLHAPYRAPTNALDRRWAGGGDRPAAAFALVAAAAAGVKPRNP